MINSDPLVIRLVDLALEEDSFSYDVTSRVALPSNFITSARIVAKDTGVFCGAAILDLIIARSGFSVRVESCVQDGSPLAPQSVIAVLKGGCANLLTLERTFLNFIQRLSGVATLTAQFVKEAGALTILDTRKTTPGWRKLEKYAVRVGGGRNHRMSLSDMVLVKNNHIDAYKGDLQRLFSKLQAETPKNIPVEVEVRTLGELKAVLREYAPGYIMLDNMNDSQIRECVAYIREHTPSTQIELSGGMTIERIRSLADLSCLVSIGALTTQARALDISMRIDVSKG